MVRRQSVPTIYSSCLVDCTLAMLRKMRMQCVHRARLISPISSKSVRYITAYRQLASFALRETVGKTSKPEDLMPVGCIPTVMPFIPLVSVMRWGLPSDARTRRRTLASFSAMRSERDSRLCPNVGVRLATRNSPCWKSLEEIGYMYWKSGQSIDECNPHPLLVDFSPLPGGVMVTQGFLVPSFLVRVQAG